MTKYFKLAVLLLALLCSTNVVAQSSGTSSSYSRFGMGILNDQSQGFNRAMGGIGIGLQAGNRVNMMNPASYSCIDSLSFIFDVSMSASFGNMKQGENSLNIKQCALEHVNAGLRLRKGLGLSFGFVPYSTVGYNFSSSSNITNEDGTTNTISSLTSYVGEGGLHQAYIGLGWNPIKRLSVGANVSFVWGEIDHTITQSFSVTNSSSSAYKGLNSSISSSVRTYKIDLGAQYPLNISPKDRLIVGAIATIGHKAGGETTVMRYTDNVDALPMDTLYGGYDMPYGYGVGLTWQHTNRLLVGLDFKHDLWQDCRMPSITGNGTNLQLTSATGSFKNRMKLAAGMQYTPNTFGNKYWKRISYRLGGNYSSPYLIVNGVDGPKEFGLTAGVGLPITNAINNRSILNLSAQWTRRAPSATSMITENYFTLNIGMTFNERWFMKFKIQ